MHAFEIGQVMTSYVVYPIVFYDTYMAEITAQDIEHIYLSRVQSKPSRGVDVVVQTVL